MNIQIFGKPKCFDTKKAERYFKEHNIKYQLIDIQKYGVSPGEYRNIKNSIGDINLIIDNKSKLYKDLFIEYLAREEAVEEKLLENPGLFKTPIVRNNKTATIGFEPTIWKTWE